MSEALKISLEGLKEWLEEETTPIVEPLKKKGVDLLDDVKAVIEEIRAVCEKFLKDSEREMAKENPKTYRRAKRASKFSRNVLETIDKIEIPKEVSYGSVKDLGKALENAFRIIERERQQWFPRISPYFFFNRRKTEFALKKTWQLILHIRNFLLKEFGKVKQVETTFSLIKEISKLQNELEKIKGRIKQMELTESSLEYKIAEIQQRIASIQSQTTLSKLAQVNEKIRELEEKVSHAFRYLQKPFLKFLILAQSKNGRLSSEEIRKLNEYRENPFEAFATEEKGCPILKSILRKMDETIVKGELKLKSSRLKKARMEIKNIMERDSLVALHQSCRKTLAEKEKLLSSDAVISYKNKMDSLKRGLMELQTQKRTLESKKSFLENDYKKILEKSQSHKAVLERLIFSLTSKKVSVVVKT